MKLEKLKKLEKQENRIRVFFLALFLMFPMGGCGFSSIWEYAGDHYLKKGKQTEALSWYKDGTRYGKSHKDLYLKWGRASIDLERWSDCQEAIDSANRALPESIEILSLNIFLLYSQSLKAKDSVEGEKFAKKGLELVGKYLELKQENAYANYYSGGLHFRMEGYSSAVGQIKIASIHAGKGIGFFEKYLKTYNQGGDNPVPLERAQLQIAQLSLTDPKAAEKCEKMAKASMGSPDEEIKAEANSILGRMALGKNETEKAEKFFNEALRYNNRHIESLLGQAFIYSKDPSRKSQAEIAYRKALKEDKRYYRTYLSYGYFLRDAKNWRDLYALMKSSKKVNSYDQKGLMLLALALLNLNQKEAARAAYNDIVRLNPDSTEGKEAQMVLSRLQ